LEKGPLPEKAQEAFDTLKNALYSEPVIAFPRSDRTFYLIVDAATGTEDEKGGLGAILCQTDERGNPRVISYASRALTINKKNYTPFLLEMQATCWGFDHFSTFLRGQKFILYTHHKPLEKLGKVHIKTLCRLNQYMNTYNFEIRHKKGMKCQLTI
jgi:hypothetical protein